MVRTIVLGNKDLSIRCLDVILRHGLEVVGVIPNEDDDGQEEGKWYKSLKKAASERGLRIFQPYNISSSKGLAFLQEISPDIMFSFSYNRILKKNILDKVKQWALNIHFSRLPYYRGCLPIVYAIANGDAQVGITLHCMDEGIDTGDIISQTMVDVTEKDTAFSVYFKCVDKGSELLDRTIPQLLRRECEIYPQNLKSGSYNPLRYPNDRWLEPKMSSYAISCFVRAHTFVTFPSARALLNGKECEVVYRKEGFTVPKLGVKEMDVFELHKFLNKNQFLFPNIDHFNRK